uniref:Transmembrane protein n=1 Tax=Lygus hesperus TaxID=30085 RepID=A0A0K8T2P4_LYGHE
MSSFCLACLVVLCVGVSSAAEFVPPHDSLIGKAVAAPRVHPESLQGFDISRLTPEQRQILAFRMELLRRRRSALAGPASNAELSQRQSATSAASEESAESGSDDLEGANTYGLGAAAFPFLGLYGLGLGGLGVGLGPLAFAGLLG